MLEPRCEEIEILVLYYFILIFISLYKQKFSYHFTIFFYPLRYFRYNRTCHPPPTNKIFRILIYFSYYFISPCSPLYSLILQFTSLESTDRHSSFHKSLPPHPLLIGDFNARHLSWDPTHSEAAINHNRRFLRNHPDSQFLSIENDTFKPTHYPDQAQYHPTIIDLIISTLSMSNYIISTETHSPNTPSDHTAITTTISAALQIFDPPSCLI
jgi:hypothetical protein